MELIISLMIALAQIFAQGQTTAQDYALAQHESAKVAGVSSLNRPIGSIVTARGVLVDGSIASSYESMVDAAKKDGIILTGTGYRSTAIQIALREKNCGTTPYDIYEKPEKDCSPPTAIPGSSMHEKGLAVDFWFASTRQTPVYAWLAKHAAEFGFFNRDDESWHWSTNGQ